jgi:7-cyano-7-deazaguanine synthase in queuosine biosynthesis
MIITLDSNKHYGFMLSGGLDSAVLLALLLKHNPILNITLFTIPKKDGASKYANDIANQFKLNSPILVGNPELVAQMQGLSAIHEIRTKHTYIEHLFFASNKVPPVNFNKPGPYRIPSSDTFFIMPFFEMYKNDIIKLAEENNLQHLYNLTHSCTDQVNGRCNVCWQCQERAWAFEQANTIDTGLL